MLHGRRFMYKLICDYIVTLGEYQSCSMARGLSSSPIVRYDYRTFTE